MDAALSEEQTDYVTLAPEVCFQDYR